MNQHLLWDLGERALWHFISTFGSSCLVGVASFVGVASRVRCCSNQDDIKTKMEMKTSNSKSNNRQAAAVFPSFCFLVLTRIAKPAYPVWPTNDRHSTAGSDKATTEFLPI